MCELYNLHIVCSYVFLFGDLNFRMDELSAAEVKSRISAGDVESLWKYDQVGQLLRSCQHRNMLL